MKLSSRLFAKGKKYSLLKNWLKSRSDRLWKDTALRIVRCGNSCLLHFEISLAYLWAPMSWKVAFSWGAWWPWSQRNMIWSSWTREKSYFRIHKLSGKVSWENYILRLNPTIASRTSWLRLASILKKMKNSSLEWLNPCNLETIPSLKPTIFTTKKNMFSPTAVSS